MTFDIANDLSLKLWERQDVMEALKYYTLAYEGRKQLLGEDAKDTLDSLTNLGTTAYDDMRDYKSVLDCYQRYLKMQEKKL